MESHAVPLLEAIDPSAAVHKLLPAREERMALAADFDLELTLGGAGNEGLTAGAAHDGLAVRRLDIFLHVLSLLCRVMHYRLPLYHGAWKMQALFFRNFSAFSGINYHTCFDWTKSNPDARRS